MCSWAIHFLFPPAGRVTLGWGGRECDCMGVNSVFTMQLLFSDRQGPYRLWCDRSGSSLCSLRPAPNTLHVSVPSVTLCVCVCV